MNPYYKSSLYIVNLDTCCHAMADIKTKLKSSVGEKELSRLR